MYTVRVVSDGASVGQGSTTCTTSPCLYVQQVSVFATNYTIFVAFINRDETVGREDSTTMNGEYHVWLELYWCITGSFDENF